MRFTLSVSKDGTDASIGVERDGKPAAVLAHITPYCGDVWKDDAEKIDAAAELVRNANIADGMIPRLKEGEKAIQMLLVCGFDRANDGEWITSHAYDALRSVQAKASPFAPPPPLSEMDVHYQQTRVLAQSEIDRLVRLVVALRERVIELGG